MGGDGGTKAVNRSYLRGAGSASTTADAARDPNMKSVDPQVVEEEVGRMMKYCSLTDQPLDFHNHQSSSSSTIVTCPYGRLYHKEAAVEALLQRKRKEEELLSSAQQQEKGGQRHQAATAKTKTTTTDLLGSHIRGLKDLYDVHFHIENGTPVCPITRRELNGKVAAFALVSGGRQKDDAAAVAVNVISEYALRQMGEDAILEEYGAATEKIRLAPPPTVLEGIKAAWEERCETESAEKKKAAKKKKKQKKKEKRKRHDDDGGKSSLSHKKPTKKQLLETE